MSRRCKHQNKDGTPCRTPARPGKSCCWVHDPDLAANRAEGRRRGGRARSRPAAVLPADTPDLPLKTTADVRAFLGVTINQVRRGELDAKVGNCLGMLAGVLSRAIEGGEMEQRMAAVEAVLTSRPGGNGRGSHARAYRWHEEDPGAVPSPRGAYPEGRPLPNGLKELPVGPPAPQPEPPVPPQAPPPAPPPAPSQAAPAPPPEPAPPEPGPPLKALPEFRSPRGWR
jgi:hypothetical protein